MGNQSVLVSIRPKWCAKIAHGEKLVEIRKTRPKLNTPFTCYIYCTLPPKDELFSHGSIREYANELIRLQSGEIVYGYGMQLCCDQEHRPYSKDNFLCQKVIGEFICNEITHLGNVSTDPWHHLLGNVHEDHKRLVVKDACLTEKELLEYGGKYAWHISNLVIYDKPKQLSEFAAVNKCPYNSYGKCTYQYHCYRAGQAERCGGYIERPPQSWCYVQKQESINQSID